MASTDIVTVPTGNYLVFNHTDEEVAQAIAASIGDTQINERNLPRVKLPSGGSTTWEIPGPFGVEASKELTGILIFFKRNRRLFPSKKMNGAPPSCFAPDNKFGIGNPGGACATCPMNQWGSASLIEGADPGSKGKACGERELWFLLRESSALPLVLDLSPGSLANAENYRIGLGGSLTPPHAIQTTVTLEKKDGPEGPFAVAVPRFSGQLDPEERKRAAAYAARMAPLFEAAAQAMTTETPSSGPMGTTADIDVDLDEPDKAGDR